MDEIEALKLEVLRQEDQIRTLTKERDGHSRRSRQLEAELNQVEPAVRDLAHRNSLLQAELNRYRSLYGKLPAGITRGETDD